MFIELVVHGASTTTHKTFCTRCSLSLFSVVIRDLIAKAKAKDLLAEAKTKAKD